LGEEKICARSFTASHGDGDITGLGVWGELNVWEEIYNLAREWRPTGLGVNST